ncbi:hypothetical protein SAMN04489712_105276 [Thermomonospora echinospora]|uniref:Uncharacterized protein n=1 Tax=Thermomonospora echinospora TaxID=1992 RepID=A0A1H6A825_9ACTN|nr:hypothetical protein [Thermomonospora echinospora]SEG44888.1 hypothetical protein SAMN04489712_105276 [Thermomonospora echinospora]
MASKVPDAIDRLYALFEAALPAATVVDGFLIAWPPGDWAVVGGDGAVSEEEDAARSTQMWKGLGARIRDESIDVICAVGSSTGNTEDGPRTRRQAAYAMLTAIEAGLRADPGLGGFTTGGAAAITDQALRYVANDKGTAAAIVFTINVPVRS